MKLDHLFSNFQKMKSVFIDNTDYLEEQHHFLENHLIELKKIKGKVKEFKKSISETK